MKNVLMIAYFYPPLGGVGSLRPLQFSRYLPEFGWNSSVVTVSNDTSYKRDDSLTQAIPSGQRITRAYRYPIYTALRKIFRGPLRKYPLAYSFLDPYFDWVPSAIRTALEICKQQDFDAIYATAPPYSCIRVGAALKKKLKLPLIADFRDPFTTNFGIKWPTKLHQIFYRIYERKLLQSADSLITVNDVIRSEWIDYHGKILPPIDVIPNGYDPAEFSLQSQSPSPERFLIGYVGSIYGGLSPLPFFKSLSLAIQQRPKMRDDLEVQFMGHMDQVSLMSDARRCGVSELVTFLGFRPHHEAISLMQRSHVLLDFWSIVAPSLVPAKMFEYGASGRPVLSFSRPGMLTDFIKKNDFGYTVDWSQPLEGSQKLVELYDLWKNNEPIVGPPKSKVKVYSRRSLTGNLARVFSQVTSN